MASDSMMESVWSISVPNIRLTLKPHLGKRKANTMHGMLSLVVLFRGVTQTLKQCRMFPLLPVAR